MGQTVRRQPGEVDIPSKDYIYHKNLIGFKGLDTRENPLVTDPLSCSDAENVWVDANGNLTTRPRLQYVRQNLKHANAEVVNVIYTDNAYWTLYIKDGVYYLTRTDLTTNVETDFTIPTLTSAKLAITEYKNVYYLGCSAGYYSCNAGDTVFQKVSGYIPAGHLGESGYIYDEARNILNNQIDIAQLGALAAVYPDGTVHGSFGKYVVYSQLDAHNNTRRVAIWDTLLGEDFEELRSNLPSDELGPNRLSVYADNTLICIALFESIQAGNTTFWLRCYRLTANTLTRVTTYFESGSGVVNRWMRSSLLNGDTAKQNTFCGIYNTNNASWTALKWSTENGHILLNASYKYLQWDYAHITNRTNGMSGPTVETGQYCNEAIQFDITMMMQLGTVYIDGETAVGNGYIRRIGLAVFAENTDVTQYYALQHISLLNTEVSPSKNYMLATVYTASAEIFQCVACNSASYVGHGLDMPDRRIYVAGADLFTDNSYPRSDMKYERITLSVSSNDIIAAVTGVSLRAYNVYTIATDDKTLELHEVYETVTTSGTQLYVTLPTPKVTNIQIVGSQRQTPQLFTASSNGVVFLYAAPTAHLSDITAISDKLTAGFSAAYGVLVYNTDHLNSYAYSYVYVTQTLDEYTPENPSLRGVLFLDNVYWWFGRTNIYGTANEDLTYMPESRKLDAPSEIRNWVRLTDTSFLVFCESDTCLYYKDTSSGLWLRTVLNLPFEILYPDETSESCYAALNTGPTYVTRNGIYEIALSENLFTNERQAQNISDPLTTLQGGLLRKLIPSIAHLQTIRYKDWQLYIFTRANATKTEIIAQEIATYNFFYWTLPIVFQSVYLAHSQVYLVTKKATTYTFSEAELLREYKNGDTLLAAIKCYGDEVYDTVKKTTSLNQIDWHWHSAVINLDTVQYYKTLLALIFGMNDYDDESRIMFEYRTDIYYKSHTEQPTQVYDDYVYKIRATQKPMAIPRFMYIRVRISSVKVPENEDCLPEEFMCKANLSQLTFKYKVLRGPLL